MPRLCSSDRYLSFGGVISGTGGFQQIGTGTTILIAANTYSGPTRVMPARSP
jgi:fibronectin-binding autotransporter adhesin